MTPSSEEKNEDMFIVFLESDTNRKYIYWCNRKVSININFRTQICNGILPLLFKWDNFPTYEKQKRYRSNKSPSNHETVHLS